MFDLTVIGGGPGGYVAALRAAQLGGRVALVEEGRLGGTCLNRGCIPTKALLRSAEVARLALAGEEFGVKARVELDYRTAASRKDRVVNQLVEGVGRLLKAARVEVIRGRGRLVSPARVEVESPEGKHELEARAVILATGSQAAMPPVPGLNLPGVMGSDEALALEEVPESLVIIGGGVIGIELACLFNTFGSRVTVVEMLPFILPPVDEEMARRITPILRRSGINILTGARLKEISMGAGVLQVKITGTDGDKELAASRVLVATGRKPNFGGIDLDGLGIRYERQGILVDRGMRTGLAGVFAVGDVTGGLLLAHVASAEGMVAAENALGGDSLIDYRVVPNCIFSFPPVAGVGLTEKQAREQGYQVQVGKFPFSASGKALAMGETEGLVKMVAEAGSGRLLGVHILGPGATEMVHEGALALRVGATARDLASTIHAHPTLSESIAEAAHGVAGTPLHLARGL